MDAGKKEEHTYAHNKMSLFYSTNLSKSVECLADDDWFALPVDPKLIHEMNLGLFWNAVVFCVRSLTYP